MTFLHTIAPSTEDESNNTGDGRRGRRGKSRRKPWRDGFSAQTVIGNIDDINCYRLFERTIISSIAPRTIIELELAHRLASLFWRLRRASAIEIGLLQLQADHLLRTGGKPFRRSDTSSVVPIPTRGPVSAAAFIRPDAGIKRRGALASLTYGGLDRSSGARAIARCFTRLSDLDPPLLDRASAYEARLWRQATQVIWMLDALRHPPPSPRRVYRKPNCQLFWGRDR